LSFQQIWSKGREGKHSPGGEGKGDRKSLTHDSVESRDTHEWSTEEVSTFLRSLGPVECYQSSEVASSATWSGCLLTCSVHLIDERFPNEMGDRVI
jgi:hypothetical protein